MQKNKPENLLEQGTENLPSSAQAGNKPSNLPDKFWDEQRGCVRLQELIDDYNYMARRDENLIETNKRHMPESYDQYQINIPNELLDHDEELFKQFYEHGFTNDQAQFVYDLANERVIPVLDQLTVNFEAQKQLAKLSSYFGGRERFDEVSRQLSGWAKQHLRPEVYDALASTAEGVIALYKMMSSNEPLLSRETGGEGELSEQSLRKMMEDPRYWRDKDTAYINKITKGFERLYPGK